MKGLQMPRRGKGGCAVIEPLTCISSHANSVNGDGTTSGSTLM